MRILVTYGSTRGGTQGRAEMVAGDLRAEGFEVIVLPPWQVRQCTRTITSQLRGELRQVA